MPIAPAQLITAEFVVNGTMSAQGSDVQRTANIFHYRRTGTVNNPVKLDMLTAFNASITNAMLAALNVTWTCDSVGVRFLEDITDPYVVLPNGGVGAIAGDRLPPYTTAYLYLKTGLRGRAYRGSKMLSPLSESDTTAATTDLINAACALRLALICTHIVAGFFDATPNTWVACVVSKLYSNFAVVPAVISRADVTSAVARSSLGHLRSRQIASRY